MNFGGIEDKQYSPMPNEGNRCAYPKCPATGIAEGQAARFAHNDSTLWCHKACADRWEIEEPGYKAGGTAVEVPKDKCGAPHPELHENAVCDKDEHMDAKDYHHHSGTGHSWYMEPGQVNSIKDAIAKQRQRVEAPLVLSDLGSEPTETGILEAAFAEAEKVGQEAATMEDLNPSPADPANIRTPVGLTSANKPGEIPGTEPRWSTGKIEDSHGTVDLTTAPTAEQFFASLPPEGTPVDLSGAAAIDEAETRWASEQECQARLQAEQIGKQLGTVERHLVNTANTVVRQTLDLIAILGNHGIHDNNDLVSEIMEWRSR